MPEILTALARRYGVVAIVTGRRSEEVERLLGVPGLRYEGLYGLEEEVRPLDPSIARRAASAALAEPAAWVDDKGSSVAIHYRQASDPPAARARLLRALRVVTEEAGLDLIEGKMVLELLAPGRPMKGAAVERLAQRRSLEAVLYAGDDHADLDAFEALDRLAESGVLAVRVAVRGDETPPELVRSADLHVHGPAGLVQLLRQLV